MTGRRTRFDKLSERDRTAFIAMYSDKINYTTFDIAERFGINGATVSTWALLFHLPLRERMRRDARKGPKRRPPRRKPRDLIS